MRRNGTTNSSIRSTMAVVACAMAVVVLLTGCECKHRHVTEATCTEPATCEKCGTELEPALGHTWVEATCTEPKTCSVCGTTEGEALGHTWVDATCTEPKTCSVCGATEGEALGHTWVDATCTEPKTCSVCDATEGEALGHTWVDATCTEPKTCSVCGETEGKALGHTPGDWTVVREATCAEEGEETATCSVCGEKLTQSIDKLEHTPGEWQVTTEATYSEAGERTQYCTVCGEKLNTEEYELTDAEKESLFKSSCQSYSYDTIARNPEDYVGKYAKLRGEVIQVIQDGDSYTLRVNITQGSYLWSDTVMMTYTRKDGESKILEDDVITFYGVLMGDYTYTSVMGASITVPLMFAYYIDF